MSSESYKNKIIKAEYDTNVLYIDDEKIQCNFDDDTKKYFAYDVLPYREFSTLEDLAKSIIDEGENS
ncbi:hypothetical protein [Nitrosopumilus ureiphilus]|uniref:Uncharacterized protein n=1 Tax=Nitrosopumilus ureiphilus TaxID=1470067 RepID=A0A7D5M657_9ARCH|nr:hypothetical protein [Nitrosopumilus ureiphilus]QLH07532.1 hypothetical protein C5F50_10965 [Nitrosopumilus ureiphilus]